MLHRNNFPVFNLFMIMNNSGDASYSFNRLGIGKKTPGRSRMRNPGYRHMTIGMVLGYWLRLANTMLGWSYRG